jgi:hypothetical protein
MLFIIGYSFWARFRRPWRLDVAAPGDCAEDALM